jgi:two-component system NarL family sensor kinase
MSSTRCPSELDRLRLIARIAARMHEEPSLEGLLQGTADAIHDMLGFPNVDIPMLDPDEPFTLVVSVRGGNYKHAIRQVDRIPVGRGIMGSAVRSRRTELVNDLRHDPRYVCPPGVAPALAELAVPIRVVGEVVGVINVESDEAFDEADRLSIESVADFLGVAIRNLRLVPAAREAAVLIERQRLARELHDNVTQILSSISLLTQTIDSAWQRDPAEGSRRIARLSELAQTAFVEMRMLLRELSPPTGAPIDASGRSSAAPPASPATAAYVPPAISKRSRTVAGLERLKEHALPGALERMLAVMLPEELEVRLESPDYVPQTLTHEEALYRICQEAASNVIRHAQARTLRVTATVTPEHAVLRVADDGRGLSPELRPGIGLSSMRSRIEALGGHFRITPNSPRGTLIEARLPRADRRR